MRKGIVENYKRKFKEFEEEQLRQEKAQEEALRLKKEELPQGVYSKNTLYTAEAVEYLKTCAFNINLEKCNKNYIITQQQLLKSIPNWSHVNYDEGEDELSFLQQALHEFIPMVVITYLYEDEDDAFELEIPTDFRIEEEIKKYQRQFEHAKEEMANREYQLECWRKSVLEYESTLQVWKKLKEGA